MLTVLLTVLPEAPAMKMMMVRGRLLLLQGVSKRGKIMMMRQRRMQQVRA
jgi:hypothetical protein